MGKNDEPTREVEGEIVEQQIREVIDEMIAICRDQDASDDQKRRAMHTIIEALLQ